MHTTCVAATCNWRLALISRRRTARCREPLYCAAETACWWEVGLLAQHVHPSVVAMARSLAGDDPRQPSSHVLLAPRRPLSAVSGTCSDASHCQSRTCNADSGHDPATGGASVVYDGDPLQDLALTSFLDKFARRRAKVRLGVMCCVVRQRRSIAAHDVLRFATTVVSMQSQVLQGVLALHPPHGTHYVSVIRRPSRAVRPSCSRWPGRHPGRAQRTRRSPAPPRLRRWRRRTSAPTRCSSTSSTPPRRRGSRRSGKRPVLTTTPTPAMPRSVGRLPAHVVDSCHNDRQCCTTLVCEGDDLAAPSGVAASSSV
jgi:CBF/Mak21 family